MQAVAGPVPSDSCKGVFQAYGGAVLGDCGRYHGMEPAPRNSSHSLCGLFHAHQAPPSLGFSRQEHWSGLPFPSLVHESEK